MNIIAKDISMLYNDIVALSSTSMEIQQGDFVLLKGENGVGKSTLISILSGLLHPTYGNVFIDGKSLYSYSQKELNNYKSSQIGVVSQQLHLFPYLSVIDNIRMGQGLMKIDKYWLQNEIDSFYLTGKENRFPSELSIGECQRVALLRALASNPMLLFVDEPTGNLDSFQSTLVLERLKRFNMNGGSVLLVSHDDKAEDYVNRTVSLTHSIGELE